MINMYECVFVECAIQNTGCRTHCTVVDKCILWSWVIYLSCILFIIPCVKP